MADTLIAVPVSTALAGNDLRPQNVKQAATQFEALLVSQMLKEMRAASGSGWLGTGEDESSASMMDFAEEHLAQVLASQGGLGLARMVIQNLGQSAATEAAGTSAKIVPEAPGGASPVSAGAAGAGLNASNAARAAQADGASTPAIVPATATVREPGVTR